MPIALPSARLVAALVLAAATTALNPASAGTPVRWDYRVERVETVTKQPVVGPAQYINASALEARLNGYGSAGWELTEVVAVPDGGALLIYKRPAEALPAPGTVSGPPESPAAPVHPLAGRASIAGAELLQRLQGGDTTLQIVDLRPDAAFVAGHIYGARSVPFTELDERHRDLRRDAALVLVDAGDGKGIGASNFLKNLGFSAVLTLEGGLASWPGGLVQGR